MNTNLITDFGLVKRLILDPCVNLAHVFHRECIDRYMERACTLRSCSRERSLGRRRGAAIGATLPRHPRESERAMRPLRLLLADDHALMLEAIELALEDDPEFEIVGRAESGSQLLPLVHRTQPDLIILDLLMPGIDGLTCLKLLRKRFPWVRTVVLSAQDSDEVIEAVLEAGAHAFVSKAVDPRLLPNALREAMDGPVASAIGRFADGLHPAVEEKGLTKREVEVLRALAAGKSNKEIACSLWLAQQTVKFHLTSIYRKLDVHGRTQAVHWAYSHGLVDNSSNGSDLAAMLNSSRDVW